MDNIKIGKRIKQRRVELQMTQGDIASRIGVAVSTVQRYEAGTIDKVKLPVLEAIARVLQVSPEWIIGKTPSPEIRVPKGFDPLPTTVRIPLIGSIACGDPITAEENIEDYVDAPAEKHPDFALLCRGDSMIDAGIADGDIVYIKIQTEVENGQIAAVRIGDEATLKRVYWDGDTLTLVPANSQYTPKAYRGEELEDIHIEGKAVGFTHWFE